MKIIDLFPPLLLQFIDAQLNFTPFTYRSQCPALAVTVQVAVALIVTAMMIVKLELVLRKAPQLPAWNP